MFTITAEALAALDRDRRLNAIAGIEYGRSRGEASWDSARQLWLLRGHTETIFRAFFGLQGGEDEGAPVPIVKARWDEYRARNHNQHPFNPLPKYFLEALEKATPEMEALARKHQATLGQTPKAPPPKPKPRVIFGAGRRIVLPDEPKKE